MSAKFHPSRPELNDCGCCEGIAAETPVEVTNRAGLSAVAYRVGVHAQFKDTLVARLSDAARPALGGLTTRDADDFSLALLDAWATVADVLTFYQERIANESYLRTATERLSVLELARLVGYELGPGVAANTYLAFTMDEAPGATRELAAALGVPRRATIDVGVKVQSIPGPGEKAQVFETVEKIEGRAEWNAIRPRLTRPQQLKPNEEVIYLTGLATGLRKGDGLLLTFDGKPATFRQVAEVETEDARQRTKVRLQPQVADAGTHIPPVFKQVVAPSLVAKKYLGVTINAADLHAAAVVDKFSVTALFDNLTALQLVRPTVLALRLRAAVFGHNAPRWDSLAASQRVGADAPYKDHRDHWVDQYPDPGILAVKLSSLAIQTSAALSLGKVGVKPLVALEPKPLDQYPGLGASAKNIFLDNVYPTIVKGSWVVLRDGGNAKAYRVEGVSEVSKSDFTLSAKVTRLTLHSRNFWSDFGIRTTTVFAQSEEMELARVPVELPVSGKEIALDALVDGLSAGQSVILCGELDESRGVTACERATINKVEQVVEADSFTRLTLSAPLANAYVRETVTINANVALATHGETVAEVLGSGDAAQAHQRFALRQPPLTYVSASTPSGTRSTLEVRVNDLLWHEVATLYGRGPEERVYVTRTNDDGKTVIQFGDGRRGARLPTGQENVRATYRKGTGLAGLVKANQLSQLMTRPLGVKGAINPLAPSGAADPEARDDARANATLTLHTLERIVSLSDYEDFARAFAGIGKARATWTWSGERRGVFVTVAGPNGADVAADSPLYENLLKAMRAAGDRAVPLQIQSYEPRFFRLQARVQVEEDHLPEKVQAEVEERLRRRFSFDARAFGQPVMLSEVVAAMQATAGVAAVDVDLLYRTGDQPKLNRRLPAAAPLGGTEKVFAAELLTLDPGPLKLEALNEL